MRVRENASHFTLFYCNFERLHTRVSSGRAFDGYECVRVFRGCGKSHVSNQAEMDLIKDRWDI